MRSIYGIFGREITKYTVIYGAYIRGSGQPYIYMVYIRYFWRGNHQVYGHIRCIYTVLATLIILLLPCSHKLSMHHRFSHKHRIAQHDDAWACSLADSPGILPPSKYSPPFVTQVRAFSVILAGKLPNTRSCSLYVRFCQPYEFVVFARLYNCMLFSYDVYPKNVCALRVSAAACTVHTPLAQHTQI